MKIYMVWELLLRYLFKYLYKRTSKPVTNAMQIFFPVQNINLVTVKFVLQQRHSEEGQYPLTL